MKQETRLKDETPLYQFRPKDENSPQQFRKPEKIASLHINQQLAICATKGAMDLFEQKLINSNELSTILLNIHTRIHASTEG